MRPLRIQKPKLYIVVTISLLSLTVLTLGRHAEKEDDNKVQQEVVISHVHKEDRSLLNVTIIPRTDVDVDGYLPPFLHSFSQMVFSEKYKLGACLIPKIMSTSMTAVLCYLQNTTSFLEEGRTIGSELWENRLCGKEIEYKTTTEFEKKENQDKSYEVFTIVRDPIERFLAAFTDKCYNEPRKPIPNKMCIEIGCDDGLECFIKKLETRLWDFVKRKRKLSAMDVHVMPQTWNCEMQRYLTKNKFYRYSKQFSPEYNQFLVDFQNLLVKKHVPDYMIDNVLKALNSSSSPHTTTGSSPRSVYAARLRARPDLMKRLINLYYYDYKVFGFPIPEV